MAYDEYLADRIRQQLVQRHQPYQERRMMGGLCFMVDDKMCLGVSDERLMVRADPDDYARLLRLPGARVMDFTGRPMKGFLFVEPTGIDRDDRPAEPIAARSSGEVDGDDASASVKLALLVAALALAGIATWLLIGP